HTLYDFTAEDGVRHTVWRAAAGPALASAFAAVPALYVADGHHRSASASRARAVCRAADPAPTGEAEYDVFLAVLFPADQLWVLPYNRVVHDLAGRDEPAFLERLGEAVTVSADGPPTPPARGRVSMYLGGRWYGLEMPPEARSDPDPVASLDAAILQERVLAPLLDIADPRISDRVDFVGGGRGTAELERRVDARPGAVAFSLHPLSVEQLMAVADAGRVLPPKTTWFEPKLRSGLLIHEF
ncbi:MAG TPA: DUF1015 family protein, partial [Thermoanaerobaculia bacterium]|nr:DUF1015 family protein [Thermoanaerobaculia bacterium]